MDLSVYIIDLLKINDCVIIPDLGGFIANIKSAVYDLEENNFVPPSTEVIFTGKLKKNDGLLVNYVAEREGVGYLEARKIVSEFVTECVSKLENGEKVQLSMLGSLQYGPNDSLQFEADLPENFRTDTFGLGSFHFPQLVRKYSSPIKPVFKDKEPVLIDRRREVTKYILYSLPLIIALSIIPVNRMLNHTSFYQQTSSTAPIGLIESPAVVKTNEQPAENSTSSVSAEVSAEKSPEIISTKPTVSMNQVSRFHLVGGCFISRDNADKLVDKLLSQGFKPEINQLRTGYYMVTVESYPSRKEANLALNKLQESEPETGYWLMVDKK